MAISLILKTSPFNLDEPKTLDIPRNMLSRLLLSYIFIFLQQAFQYVPTLVQVRPGGVGLKFTLPFFDILFISLNINDFPRSLPIITASQPVISIILFASSAHFISPLPITGIETDSLLLSLLYPNPPFRCVNSPAFCRVSQRRRSAFAPIIFTTSTAFILSSSQPLRILPSYAYRRRGEETFLCNYLAYFSGVLSNASPHRVAFMIFGVWDSPYLYLLYQVLPP